ncbi:MAG: hypothetical protein ACRCTB_12010 [Vibrio sp.]
MGRMLLATVLCSTMTLSGCAGNYVNDDNNKIIAAKMAAGQWPPRTVLDVYDIKSGVQYWEGQYINENMLRRIANQVTCKKDNPFTYSSKAVVDFDSSTVKVTVNREDCTANIDEIAKIVSDGVPKERERQAAQISAEIARERANPKRIYVRGCQAASDYIEGRESSIHVPIRIDDTSLNQRYALDLYKQGVSDRNLFGVSRVSCEGLAFEMRGLY